MIADAMPRMKLVDTVSVPATLCQGHSTQMRKPASGGCSGLQRLRAMVPAMDDGASEALEAERGTGTAGTDGQGSSPGLPEYRWQPLCALDLQTPSDQPIRPRRGGSPWPLQFPCVFRGVQGNRQCRIEVLKGSTVDVKTFSDKEVRRSPCLPLPCTKNHRALSVLSATPFCPRLRSVFPWGPSFAEGPRCWATWMKCC